MRRASSAGSGTLWPMLERLSRSRWMQAALVALVAACVYFPFLGNRPLDMSEGHRAVPGWTMLATGDFWHQKMFELTYIRKPPGIAWAIAGSSALLGDSTLTARLPSALAAVIMSVLAWWYARRWFGRDGNRWAGVAAGLSQALMPLMWSPGRTAEIEMLNNLGAQMLGLGLIDLLLRGRTPTRREDSGPLGVLGELGGSMGDVLVPAAGLLIAAMAKGPASAPVLAGVVLAACVVRRSARPLVERGFWLPVMFGLGVAVVLLLKFQIANDVPGAVREDVAGQFLWSIHRVLGVLTLAPIAFFSAMPASLALLGLVLGRGSPALSPEQSRIGRGLAWAWIASVGVLVLAGVSNARYAMPAAVLLPPLVSCTMTILLWKARQTDRSGMQARVLLLGRPAVWACVMALGAGVFVAATSLSPTRDQRAGVAAAEVLTGFARAGEIWADDAIEARPDVLWMLQRATPSLKVRWARAEMAAGDLPPAGNYMLLRTDDDSREGLRYLNAINASRLTILARADVRRYQFTLYEVRAVPGVNP